MAKSLARHGSEAGYRAELKTDNVCARCRNGHRQYDRQFSKAFKAKGVKYNRYDVIDHLYQPAASARPARGQARAARTGQAPAREPAGWQEDAPDSAGEASDDEARVRSLADRVGDALGKAVNSQPYVESDEPPSDFQEVDPDPEPADGEWSEVSQADFVINAATVAEIEENLATYMSVVGITLEMVDPYCGAIAADNLDNMVKKWTKVIVRYPKAAALFMDAKGGLFMTWIGALQSTWPLVKAVYDHHLARTVRTENGRVFFKNQSANGGPRVDATMPPMPQDAYQYSAG